MKIRIAHSPDSDDAFMFYPLTKGIIDTEGFEFEHVLHDIETLNKEAFKGTYEVTAISFHVFPYVSDKYIVLTSGGSVGKGYGPIIVAREKLDSLEGKKIAIPGRYTTAFLLLKLYEDKFTPVELPFDKILDEVAKGTVDAGLIIHEGQISYKNYGLEKLIDLGEWWEKKTSLPTPLGCVAVRRDIGKDNINKINSLVRKSIEYSLLNKRPALEFAINYAREIKDSFEKTETFVDMYVNQYTLDYGKEGKEAVKLLLKLGCDRGVISKEVPPTVFIDEL